jgi:hypothetical protein
VTATGLFLGAGASFESVPLASDLTAEIKSRLTPEKLRELNTGWRAQGTGYPDAVIDSLVASLLNPSMHYENALGNLEVQFKRPSDFRQAYHGLYARLVELVYYLRTTATLGTRPSLSVVCDISKESLAWRAATPRYGYFR